jgi:RimJ/RimL family protein N-acetyltransferase
VGGRSDQHWCVHRLHGTSPPGVRGGFHAGIEIGYRFAWHAWGQGYATEAAREAVRFAFVRAGPVQIVSMTAVGNVRSRAVMNKLGMTHDP